MSEKFRCFGNTPLYADYHDNELQAVGMVNDHLKPCFVCEEMKSNGLLG